MIYRAKVGLQNTKQIVGYSPLYSPSHHKKTSVIKSNKFSPKPTQRENKENMQQKQPKTDRAKEEKYFKISKDETLSSVKKPPKNSKLSISISINDKKKSISQFDDFGLLNIETPKFKCSSNKIDDRCKTEYFNATENYFSFGDDFRENIKINLKPNDFSNFPRQKKPITSLKERNKNPEQDLSNSQKISLDTVKKRQKMQRTKQTEQKLELRFVNHDRQAKETKFRRDRDVFCFKK